MLAPFALHAAAFIISTQQAALVSVTHETLFPWQALSLGVHVERACGQIANPSKTPLIPFLGGGGSTQWGRRHGVKYAQAIQRVCIIERSKWVQDEHHGSLIVNVFTVSGKTAVWARGKIIEMVKSKRKNSFVYSATTVTR